MEKDDLRKIINTLELYSSEEDAYFEFTFEESDHAFIKSNKEGILLFSKELLSTLVEFNERDRYDNADLNINISDWFINGDVFAPYIKPIYEIRSNIIQKEKLYKSAVSEKFMPFLFIAILLIMLICFIIGFIQVLNWIF